MKCKICGELALVGLRSHNAAFCGKCYLEFFRRQVKKGIESKKLFSPRDRILVALSGGKDSLGLMLELHEQGYNTEGLFVDLAIPESSSAARQVVEKFCAAHELALKVINLADEDLAIPIVKKYLRRPVCSVCGKIKRHIFNREAIRGGYDVLATGHNLDDEVGRLFSNTLRWDLAYLSDQGPLLEAEPGFARKVKPLWRLTEFETANYAFMRNIPHHSAPCPYSPGASFTVLKGIMQDLETAMPGKKLDFYQGFLERGKTAFAMREKENGKTLYPCAHCGSPTSGSELCGVCRIREFVSEAAANAKGIS